MTEKWEKEVHPEVEDNLYHSSLSFDIQTVLGELGQGSGCTGAPGEQSQCPPALPPAVTCASHAPAERIAAENAAHYSS